MGLHLPLQVLDLSVEGGDHRRGRHHRGRVGAGEHVGLAQLLGAQQLLDPGGLGGPVPAAGPLEGLLDPLHAQPGRGRRVWGRGQQLQHVRGGQVGQLFVGGQRGREVLPQRRAQPRHVPGPFPHHRLVRPRHHLDRLSQRGIPGHRPQLVGIDAHHVGQGVRIPRIRLGPRRRVPLPIAGHLQRVHREHPIPGRDQRGHPRAAVGLDTDHHLPGPGRVVRVSEPADQLVQPGQALHTLRQPRRGQPPPRLALHLHIMVILSPVVPDEQHHRHDPLLLAVHHRQPAGRSPRTNGSVLTPLRAGTTSQQRSRPPGPPAGARSRVRTHQRPVGKSAHPPAATGTEPALCRPGRPH